MSRIRQSPVISVRAPILLALLVIVHGHVFAQSGSIEVPENARVKEYGNGWECNLGYRAVDEACTVVKLPANAYLTNTSYGSGWECERGFRAAKEACVAVVVPDNAYLNSTGTDWVCNRPYSKRREKCTLR